MTVYAQSTALALHPVLAAEKQAARSMTALAAETIATVKLAARGITAASAETVAIARAATRGIVLHLLETARAVKRVLHPLAFVQDQAAVAVKQAAPGVNAASGETLAATKAAGRIVAAPAAALLALAKQPARSVPFGQGQAIGLVRRATRAVAIPLVEALAAAAGHSAFATIAAAATQVLAAQKTVARGIFATAAETMGISRLVARSITLAVSEAFNASGRGASNFVSVLIALGEHVRAVKTAPRAPAIALLETVRIRRAAHRLASLLQMQFLRSPRRQALAATMTQAASASISRRAAKYAVLTMPELLLPQRAVARAISLFSVAAFAARRTTGRLLTAQAPEALEVAHAGRHTVLGVVVSGMSVTKIPARTMRLALPTVLAALTLGNHLIRLSKGLTTTVYATKQATRSLLAQSAGSLNLVAQRGHAARLTATQAFAVARAVAKAAPIQTFIMVAAVRGLAGGAVVLALPQLLRAVKQAPRVTLATGAQVLATAATHIFRVKAAMQLAAALAQHHLPYRLAALGLVQQLGAVKQAARSVNVRAALAGRVSFGFARWWRAAAFWRASSAAGFGWRARHGRTIRLRDWLLPGQRDGAGVPISLVWPVHPAGGMLEYSIDLAGLALAGATVNASCADPTLTVRGVVLVGDLLTLWLAGGASGATYAVAVAIAAQGRVWRLNVSLYCQ